MYSLNVAVYEELLATVMDLLGVGTHEMSAKIEDGN